MNIQVLLEKYFDVAFAAPNGVKKLRELILSLAMQGKLVAQDPHDVPASELLKEIEAEKNRLVKAGKIKLSKSLPEIKPDEVTYDLPKSWEWVRLNNVLDVRDGTHDTPKYVDIGYPLITSKNLYTGVLSFEDIKFISEEDHRKINERSKVDIGDILFAMIGSIGNPVIVDCREDFSIKNVALFKFYLTDKPSNRYLHYFLKQAQESMKANSSGAVQNFVSLGFLRNYMFPLPPLPEQRRIVAKIDELMARCDELEKLRGNLNQKQITVHNAALNRLLTAKDQSEFNTAWQFITQHFGELYSVKENVAELRKAILQLAVMGKLVPQDPIDEPAKYLLERIAASRKNKSSKNIPPKDDSGESLKLTVNIPESWKLCQLWQIATVCLGGTPSRNELSFWDGNIPWVSSGEVANCRIESTEEYITDNGLNNSNAKIYPRNTVLIAMIGQGKTRGQSAILDIEACTNQNVAGLVFESGNIDPNYVWKWALSEYEKTRSGSRGGAQPALNGRKVSTLWIPIPPLAEQHRIVAKCDRLMTLCDTLEKQIDETNSKKTNLLNAVMTKV